MKFRSSSTLPVKPAKSSCLKNDTFPGFPGSIMDGKHVIFSWLTCPTFTTKTTPLPVMTTVKTKCFKQFLGKLWGVGGWKPTPKKVIQMFSGWWFETCFYFHPYLGKWSNLTNIFQMGWNHQLVLGGSRIESFGRWGLGIFIFSRKNQV